MMFGKDKTERTEQWERDLLRKIALAGLIEQRRARRWGIFFKLLLFVYLFAVLAIWLPGSWTDSNISTGPHTAVVDVRGIIVDEGAASSEVVITGLRNAFEDDKTKGVILRINSPGGSPVQAGYINDEIARLREEHPDTPIYAVITDICTSGGYYIAAAADEIYADKASIVGSIGVLMNGFGFVDTLKALGIERRLLTAGERKGLLDPFSPAREEDVRHIQELLDRIHQQFIAKVKDGRGERLKDNPDLFSGLVWTGEQSIEIGLVDGLGSSDFVARELIGAEKIVDFSAKAGLLERLAEGLGSAMGRAFGSLAGTGGARLW